ncbi:MAG TPA: (d)CMP kinase [Acidimicrobiales bacterium]|nr:(d)CMP kinase [Acidimicrobiales bacterium]
MPGRRPLIAIDGPAGSGKSTVARAVARRLGVDHLDTGAMYRAVAYASLERDVDPADAEAVAALAAGLVIEVDGAVLVDGVDASAAVRGPEVTAVVSAVASVPAVRAELVRRQRAWASSRDGGVVEGRDIGSVVFPGADVKVYLTASDEERSRRRAGEGGDGADLARRDGLDASRAVSPLQVAEGAVVVDTTGLSVDEVVDAVLALL